MKTLLITDLPLSADLDAAALSAIHGGKGYGMPYSQLPGFTMPAPVRPGDVSFNAAQTLGQSQETVVNNGNNVAFSSGICATVNPSQNGTNTINFR